MNKDFINKEKKKLLRAFKSGFISIFGVGVLTTLIFLIFAADNILISLISLFVLMTMFATVLFYLTEDE